MIKFKTKREEIDFWRCDYRLQLGVMGVAAFVEYRWGQDLVVTSCIRTREEQAALNVKNGRDPARPSVHESGRAVDIRSSSFTAAQIAEIGLLVAGAIEYQPGAASFKVWLPELDAPGGAHIHMQVGFVAKYLPKKPTLVVA